MRVYTIACITLNEVISIVIERKRNIVPPKAHIRRNIIHLIKWGEIS